MLRRTVISPVRASTSSATCRYRLRWSPAGRVGYQGGTSRSDRDDEGTTGRGTAVAAPAAAGLRAPAGVGGRAGSGRGPGRARRALDGRDGVRRTDRETVPPAGGAAAAVAGLPGPRAVAVRDGARRRQRASARAAD